jgi:hypothetical protein
LSICVTMIYCRHTALNPQVIILIRCNGSHD